MTGTSIAVALSVIISPVLSRLYTPEDFGVFALFIQFVTLLSVISTGRYEFAIVLPKEENEALLIKDLAIFILASFSICILIVLLIFQDYFLILINKPELKGWVFLLPLMVLLTSTARTIEQLSIRTERYKNLAKSKILQSSLSSASNVSFGIMKFGYLGLILGNIIGSLSFIYNLTRKFSKILLLNMNLKSIKSVALKYKQFVVFDLPNIVIAIAGQRAFGFLLFFFAGAELAGVYFLAERIIKKPGAIISQSLQKPLYQYQSSLNRDRIIIATDANKKANKLFFLFPIYLFLLLIPAKFYAVLFGSTWINLKIFVDAFLVVFFLGLVYSPYTFVYRLFQRQDIALKLRFFEVFKIAIFFFVFKNIADPRILVLWLATVPATIGLIYSLVACWFLTKHVHWPNILKYCFVIGAWYVIFSLNR